METVTVQDVGPVQSLSVPIQPGVVVLRGPNDCDKSETLKAMSRLTGGTDTITRRDKSACGYVEGLGVKISVRQSARRTGELEAVSIEGKLSIADLVSPPIKDPVAADRQRIKALLQLTGVKADASLFSGLWNHLESQVLSADCTQTDDLVEMAARIKRCLESASRPWTLASLYAGGRRASLPMIRTGGDSPVKRKKRFAKCAVTMTAACLTPSCGRPVSQRGLCGNCSTTAHRMVRRGETTMAKLEELGLILPGKTRVPSIFRVAFERANLRKRFHSRRKSC